MAKGLFQKLFGKKQAPKKQKKRTPAHYKAAKSKAASRDVQARRTLAAKADTEPEILYFLAEDPDPGVRQAIAENEATPRHADLVLARDDDGAVRSSLAEKLARLAPRMTPDEQDKVRAMTHQILEILAHDQMVRVREILSDVLKAEANASPDLIRRLAWDAELVVSGPVLEHSPVLTDADLLEIIKSGPIAGALESISRRKNLMATVADAIVDTDDVEAITQLLDNDSAQIREETLDELIERAERVASWQGPLVRRPVLSPRAATRLAEFVAENLLETLAMRRDLPLDVIEKVRVQVRTRLGVDPGAPPAPKPQKSTPSKPRKASAKAQPMGTNTDRDMDEADTAMEDALIEAQGLYKKGGLGNDVILAALNADRRNFVMAALAVRAEMPVAVVEKIMENESVKGLVALSWKAGLPARSSVQLQRFLLRILPGDVLGGDGMGYPLNEDDMTWQLDFFADMI